MRAAGGVGGRRSADPSGARERQDVVERELRRMELLYRRALMGGRPARRRRRVPVTSAPP